ncbi:unnamed protein product [Nippostrongylus brasiliensis]|uniref:DOMON domain-containing protein n=1 Tax=Nippostrongylus brasiliensis TaxID=27835 RepID=A0A0N4YNH0_NIPBR|nr:unnamed protein product [Nippostrongylus brasiliensis]
MLRIGSFPLVRLPLSVSSVHWAADMTVSKLSPSCLTTIFLLLGLLLIVRAEFKADECSHTKLCMRLPVNCSEQDTGPCLAHASFKKQGPDMEIEVDGQAEDKDKTGVYVALAFSKDDKMV